MSNVKKVDQTLGKMKNHFRLGLLRRVMNVWQFLNLRFLKTSEHMSSKKSNSREGSGSSVGNLDKKFSEPSVSQDTRKEEIPYKWIEKHPWKNVKVKEYLDKDFVNLISDSPKYPINKKWKLGAKIDLQIIYKNLPDFIKKMECRYTENTKPGNITETPKNARKTMDNRRGKTANQNKSLKNEKYTAQSLSPDRSSSTGGGHNIKYLCMKDYVLKISVPLSEKRIGFLENADCTPERKKRWIFIPSYMRANCALFDWSNAGIREENNIRIVVVRPDQFKEYIKHCGHHLPIVQLPNDQIGVGYARYWIQKIATSLGLEYIWMIDDDVKQFFEMHPTRPPPGRRYKPQRRRSFEEVFTKIEDILKDCKDEKLAAISPAVFWPAKMTKTAQAFVRKPPCAVVFLNLRIINQHGVSYRPQLAVFEDMLFGKECEEKGLKVIIWNRVNLYKMQQWTKTGCYRPANSHVLIFHFNNE